MQVFWAKGVAATSCNDLVTVTGLSRKALYASWPDKAALMTEALVEYRDQVLTNVMSPLQQGAAGLREFWDGQEKAAMNPDFHGCFMVNSGTGPEGCDPQIPAMYAAHLDRLQSRVETAIRQGQTSGDIELGIDAQRSARLAVALAVQMQTMQPSGHHRTRFPHSIALAREVCGIRV